MLISFEGHEGSGKSTQAKLLVDALNAQGYIALLVREPGTTALGEEIRNIVSKPRQEVVCPETELFLFQAARSQLVTEVIKPALTNGTIVVADRFIDSTWVYQGYGRSINLLSIEFTNRLATAGIKIDKTFLLKLPLEISLERVKQRSSLDRFESEGKEFFQKIYTGYNEIAKLFPDRIEVVDGNRSVEEIHIELLAKTIKEINK